MLNKENLKNIFHTGPWPIATIVLISLAFTPIVGGILAAFNEKRLGYPERRWREYALSLFIFLWYLVYFYFDHTYFQHSASPLTLYIPPLAVIASLLISPVASLIFLALPSALIIYLLVALQRKSYSEGRVKQAVLSPWWSAYLFAALLMPIVGFFLFETQYQFVDFGIYAPLEDVVVEFFFL